MALSGAYFGSGRGDIVLDNVVCRGTESSLLECSTNPIGQHNCDHSEDAGVRCEGINFTFKSNFTVILSPVYTITLSQFQTGFNSV